MCESRTALADRNIRCTRQRVEVYRALAATRCHPTAEELHRLVQAESPGTSLATVYNTLEALCDAGLARRLPSPSGAARYDADLSEHVHAVGSDGRVIDLPPELGAEILSALPPELRCKLSRVMGCEPGSIAIQFGGRKTVNN